MKYEVPCPFPTHRSVAESFGNILGSKCIGATIRPNFSRFFLFCIAFVSFLFLLSFLISSYSSLLILLFLPLLILLVGAILRLLILLFLYFKLFVVLQTCILMIYTYPSFSWVFRGGQAFFDLFGVNFFVSSFFIVFYLFFLLFSSYSSLLFNSYLLIPSYSSRTIFCFFLFLSSYI